ncbi:MAG: 50S ribosomal protein L6 [Bacteroidetes bacterium]|nr:50S ribosomal protein L6 [Bacteroidota bacterium]
MSRVGKKQIAVPANVQVTVAGGILKAKGPKGELMVRVPSEISYSNENNIISFARVSDQKDIRALHGLTRALSANAIEGVVNGFQRNLIIEGVGYRAEMRGNRLYLALGYSHPILFIPPDGIDFVVPAPTQIQVKGIDKHLVGEIASKIRRLRPPEPYKGKGVRYEGEQIRRKAGKSAGK